MSQLPPPGWHPDPHGVAALRWWDGAAWTEHVHPPPQTHAERVAGAMVDAWEAAYEDDHDPVDADRRRAGCTAAERPATAAGVEAVVGATADDEAIVMLGHHARALGRLRVEELAVVVVALTTQGGLVGRVRASVPDGAMAPVELRREPRTRVRLVKPSLLNRRGPLRLGWSEEGGITLSAADAGDRRRAEAFLATWSPEPLDRFAAALRGA